MPLFPAFPGLPIPGKNIQRFEPLTIIRFSQPWKFCHRRFGQDSGSYKAS
jgi:hypothetical protein